MERIVYILSGIPGSGKSYWTKGLPYSAKVSADHFFTGPDGVYRFDPARLTEAHATCFRSFIQAMTDYGNGEGIVIVDNTNLSAAEIAPYYLGAQAYGFSPRVLRFPCAFELAFKRQTHNVPRETMARMFSAFAKRDVMPWWQVTDNAFAL